MYVWVFVVYYVYFEGRKFYFVGEYEVVICRLDEVMSNNFLEVLVFYFFGLVKLGVGDEMGVCSDFEEGVKVEWMMNCKSEIGVVFEWV